MNRLNQKGQGTTEYVVILVGIVAIALVLGTKLKDPIESAIASIASSISGGG